MESFIQKIFEGDVDELVHLQFQKFSKGEFENRAMAVVKKTGSGFSVSAGPEYAKELVMAFAEKLGSERTQVTGALISALDLDGFNYKEKKSAIGVRKYVIESEMSGSEIVELCERIPKAFFGLSFKVGDSELKIKSKSPKSAKGASSSKNGVRGKVDFCKLKTSDRELVRGLLFDSELQSFNWKKVEISHDFIIEEIVVSDELKSSCGDDFGLLRKRALRKGRVVRHVVVDGVERVSEKEFEA